jgi:hypothetical protein
MIERRLLTVLPPDVAKISSSDKPDMRSPSRELDDGVHRTRRKRIKGWDGESVERHPPQNPIDGESDITRGTTTIRLLIY